MIINDKLLSEAISEAERTGADNVDVFASSARRAVVSVDGGAIHNVRVWGDSGIGIRAFHKGGVGFAYSMQNDMQSIIETAQRSAKLAMSAQKDSSFKSLPKKAKYPHINGLYDRRLASLSTKELVRMVEKAIVTAKKIAGRGISIRGDIDATLFGECAIANSNGVHYTGRGTAIGGYFMVKIEKSKSNIGSGMEYSLSRSLDDFDLEYVARESAEKAVRNLNARKTKTRVATVLLTPNAVQSFIGFLAQCLDGTAVSYGLSCLASMRGKKIASDLLTIFDNGCLEGGLGSSPVDAEGTPKKPFAVIENGVLKNYLHTSYSAGRMGEENTGSASRSSYKSGVSTGFSNVIIEPGYRTSAELIGSVSDGIMLDSFPRGNPVMGAISSMVDYGIEIKRGELRNAVKGAILGTNLLAMLYNISAVSKDTRNIGGSIYPWLLVEGVNIAG